ncbi:MAG: type II secretion system protein GspM [Thiomicrospira sp.]
MSVQTRLSALWLARWQGLAARERAGLVLLAVLLLVWGGYSALWQPLQQRASLAEQRWQQVQANWDFMQQNAPLVQAYQNAQPVLQSSAQLLALLQQSLRSYRLVGSDVTLNQQGEAVVVELARVESARLLGWLAHIESQGVQVSQAQLSQLSPGFVKARVQLTRPNSP